MQDASNKRYVMGHFVHEQAFTLVIQNLSYFDSGEYTCSAEDANGWKISKSKTVLRVVGTASTKSSVRL